MQIGKGHIQIPPAVSHSLREHLSLTVPLSFQLCDAYRSASVMRLCVGDKDTARSSCSLIMELIYQADLLLCRLRRVIQSARNSGCTWQRSQNKPFDQRVGVLNIPYYQHAMFLFHHSLEQEQYSIISK